MGMVDKQSQSKSNFKHNFIMQINIHERETPHKNKDIVNQCEHRQFQVGHFDELYITRNVFVKK